ncbi:multiple C2 and transmembrane domain-containing protein-like [Galleria mellonella]|uniref:Multiple C2 and transmembrane domain-containing protein-like n=1 Tax=Galleria mellonella TaxID=7137 RepID=A0A6J1X3L7_GALME|nr:multiple C2 and transmembrane domain-containing protein-like [Galleria mellonella]
MGSENNNHAELPRRSIDSNASSSASSAVVLRKKNSFSSLWRGSKKKRSLLESIPSTENLDTTSIGTNYTIDKTTGKKYIKGTVVTVVLVEAKDLPNTPDDGSTHGLFCRIRLGSKTLISKVSTSINHPEWKERFELQLSEDHLLRISLWDKGKQKNFMGRCVLDLLHLEKDRTHEFWQQLDDGYGSVHFSVTLCDTRKSIPPSTNDVITNDVIEKYAIHNLTNDWNEVGQLHVKVIGAKGFNANLNAYCTLELDNQRVQTHSVRVFNDQYSWDRSYVFNVYDITSSLDLKVYDDSILNSIRSDSLGRVSIPLLRISNKTPRWYALKDKSKKNAAKGNCPRLLLEMSVYWNPVKAAVKMFRPKEVKYLKKPPKFDVILVHSNLEFIRDTFEALYQANEQFKHLFEWENQELSFIALVIWIWFWYCFRMWTTPLLLLIPFIYSWLSQRNKNQMRSRTVNKNDSDRSITVSDVSDNEKLDFKTMAGKMQGLPEMTLYITKCVEYMVCLSERIQNLATFQVPFLSYLGMLFLVIASIGLYLIPFNYMMIGLGIYKFTRKYMDPERTPNNDILDFISRIPDNEQLRQWKELNVPEPLQTNHIVNKPPIARSFSTL